MSDTDMPPWLIEKIKREEEEKRRRREQPQPQLPIPEPPPPQKDPKKDPNDPDGDRGIVIIDPGSGEQDGGSKEHRGVVVIHFN